MAKASDTQGIFYQNLIDAGCDQETVERCLSLAQREQTPELLRLLARHRKALLNAVHLHQKQIDYLDYLIYKTEKEQKTGGVKL